MEFLKEKKNNLEIHQKSLQEIFVQMCAEDLLD